MLSRLPCGVPTRHFFSFLNPRKDILRGLGRRHGVSFFSPRSLMLPAKPSLRLFGSTVARTTPRQLLGGTLRAWLKWGVGASVLGFGSLLADAYWFAPPEQYPPIVFNSQEQEVEDAIRRCRELSSMASGGFFYYVRAIKQVVVFFSAVMVLGVTWVFPFIEGVGFWYFQWALGACGPFTIKAGQWMSQYSNVFGDRLTSLLASFQDDAPTHSFKQTKRTLETFYGKPLDQVFDDGELAFLACGSIAQVYRAKVGGREVIVKVRHPGAMESICQDVEMLLWVSRVATWFFPGLLGKKNLTEIVSHFSSSMIGQLDLMKEAQNIENFRRNFAQRTDVVFPEPLLELCGGVVLVETFEEGRKAKDFALQEEGCDEGVKKLLARGLIQNYLKMGMIDNFSHDDLHGGNVLVRWVEDDRGWMQRGVGCLVDTFSSWNSKRSFSPSTGAVTDELSIFRWDLGLKNQQQQEKGGTNPAPPPHPEGPLRPQIVILDCGSVSQLTQENFHNFTDLAQAFLTQGSELSATLMVERTPLEKLTGTAEDREKFVVEMTELLDELWGAGVVMRRIAVKDTFVAISDLASQYGIPLDPVFTTRMLGTCLVESLAREINPDVDFITEGAAFFATDHGVRRKTIRRFIALFEHAAQEIDFFPKN